MSTRYAAHAAHVGRVSIGQSYTFFRGSAKKIREKAQPLV
ncbi:hypothetical protein HMPREF9999_00667 [Alloprevotella sp. oral taxon 473 str. F0040]|nr:hypothetical protein HMPREF9999_00667 [Alloprevotella sp. oral taxon 473 str. F0040]